MSEIDYTDPADVLPCVLAQLEDLSPEHAVQVLEEALRSARLNLAASAGPVTSAVTLAVEMNAPHDANMLASMLRSYGFTATVRHRVVDTNAPRERIIMAVDAMRTIVIGAQICSITERS